MQTVYPLVNVHNCTTADLNNEPNLPPVQLHYPGFGDWLLRTAYRCTELRDERIKYWNEKLQGVQTLILTLSEPSEVGQSAVTQRLDPKALKMFNDYVATTSATLFPPSLLLITCCPTSTLLKTPLLSVLQSPSVRCLNSRFSLFAVMLPIRTTIKDDMNFPKHSQAFCSDFFFFFFWLLVYCAEAMKPIVHITKL